MMQVLDKNLRSALEKTVRAARRIAKTAAHAAVDQVGVGQDKPEAFLSDNDKSLRNRLRTHGKQLGDTRESQSTNPTYGKQEVWHLVQEVAYQHWHRMLFARFLADNDLLMYDGVPVTIEECEELAADEGAKSGWELAGKLAAVMLPQVFKPRSPVFELSFAPEHQSELEGLLKGLPDTVFMASDSLGWVYQFWQADNKERINKSEVKIGAEELPAVTQLFTEPYMVAFLLDNSLGAWWATRHPGKQCPVKLDYFRTLEDGTPAAGKFEGWPESLANFKLLDPCCGSGHFLVAALLMLVPMRIASEGLSAKEAVNRVLAENLHGLELDPRCVEIAVFAVAFAAWRYPDASGNPLGVREIPAPNIACCGLKVAAKVQDWEALVPDDIPNVDFLRQELRQLHASFAQAPLLGSLLDPSRNLKNDLASSNHETLKALLNRALATERPVGSPSDVDERWELALSAQGLLESARILSDRYHLVATNVPYRSSNDLNPLLNEYFIRNYSDARTAIETVFLLRCLELCTDGGTSCLVLPQDWLFKTSYEAMRKKLLTENVWGFIALLGPKAFQTPMWDFNVQMLILSNPVKDGREATIAFNQICGIDVSSFRNSEEKATRLQTQQIHHILQSTQLRNPDTRVSLQALATGALLGQFAKSVQGIKSGDDGRVSRRFWEFAKLKPDWTYYQSTVPNSEQFGGLDGVIFWRDDGRGLARRQGNRAWGNKGLAVSQMASLPSAIYLGEKFDSNMTAIVPINEDHFLPLLAYGLSGDLSKEVRKIDASLKPTNGSFEKIPFDLKYWQSIAIDQFGNGPPKPFSNDPTQWIFHGHPKPATDPLQVAVARLLGYQWPSEIDADMELSDGARSWMDRCKALAIHADQDGIVCIPPVGSEPAASERLLNLLADAFETDWSNDVLAQLLTAADHAGKSLETWLRDKFFTQHCALFGNRPFVWHVWDGLPDGFAALVNYHKLDYKTLEALIYTYLGDWIGRQKRDADNGVDGAQVKITAAEALKKRLVLILAGEAPYDLFVRWKPIEEQTIGWNPDLNDGVRLNIRPFLSVPDAGKRGAGVLRNKLKSLHWEKDRGSDVPSAPWYDLGLRYGGKVGDRINDHHLSLAEKREAREKAK